MPMDDLGLSDIAAKSLGAGLLGMIGRAVHIAARTDRPAGIKALFIAILWEIPIGLGMGVVGWGLADYLELKAFPHYAMVVSVAIAGPKLIAMVLDVAVERLRGLKAIPVDRTTKPPADPKE